MTERRFHEVAAIFPMMTREEIARLAEDIRENGQQSPIWLYDDQVIDGRNRWLACRQAGLEPWTEEWDGEGSLVAFVVSLNLHRRHLTESQRAMVASRIATLQDGQKKSGAQICAASQDDAAEMLAVSRRSVQTARAVSEHGDPSLVEAVDSGAVSVHAAADVATLPKEEQQSIVARGEKEILEAARRIREDRRRQSQSVFGMSDSNEWYTPGEYVSAARELMGGIDLDPASCEQANGVVNAGTYYTEQDDGLSKQWNGRVWLNPPYGRDDEGESNQGRWSARLLKEYAAGRVDGAVLLVNAVTDRKWFAPLWEHCICFVSDRIKFYAPDGRKPQPTHGNVLVYLGDDADRFIEIFSKFGRCVVPRGSFSEAA